jgi:hypothetical protein
MRDSAVMPVCAPGGVPVLWTAVRDGSANQDLLLGKCGKSAPQFSQQALHHDGDQERKKRQIDQACSERPGVSGGARRLFDLIMKNDAYDGNA